MQYSPKLKIAIDEIKEVLSKYDIAGFIVLHTAGKDGDGKGVEGFCEYLLNIDKASYSALQIKPNGEGYMVKGKSSHYENKEARDFAMAATQNMLSSLSEVAGQLVLSVINIDEKINYAFGKGDHDKGDHTSNSQQNN